MSSILLSRPATAAGNQQRVVWGGVPLVAPNTDEGSGYVTLVSGAGAVVDTVTDSSDGKISILVGTFNSPWDKRNEETKQFAMQHYINVISDLAVVLKVRK